MTARSSSIQATHPSRHNHTEHGNIRPSSYGTRGTHQASHPHSRASRQPKAPEHRGGWLWLTVAVVVVAAVAAAAWTLVPGREKADTVSDLLDQMAAMAEGTLSPTYHALGGRLYAKRENNQVTVVAGGLPQKECVQAGWALTKRGLVTVNGVTPQRVSAAILADLCAKGEEGSKLEWMPKPE